MTKSNTATNRLSRLFSILAIWLILLGVMLSLAEGIASIVVVVLEHDSRPWLNTQHGKFDDALGWTHVPNTLVKFNSEDVGDISIDKYGFRRSSFSRDIKTSQNSILCLGDSFTFGNGVADDQTWCDLLQKLGGNVITYNLGVQGYGIDQVYLRFKAEQQKLNYNLVIFAFITDDFKRMHDSTLFGQFTKPVVGLKNGVISPINTPLTPLPFWEKTLAEYSCDYRQLRLSQLFGKLDLVDNSPIDSQGLNLDETKNITHAIVNELVSIAHQRSAEIAFVLLPRPDDYYTENSKAIVEEFESIIKSETFHFINLVDDLRHVNPLEVDSLFFENSRYRGVDGHPSIAGHRFIAKQLFDKIQPLLKP